MATEEQGGAQQWMAQQRHCSEKPRTAVAWQADDTNGSVMEEQGVHRPALAWTALEQGKSWSKPGAALESHGEAMIERQGQAKAEWCCEVNGNG